MTYCTIDDVKKMIDEIKLIRLTDDENTGAINSDRLQEAINSAAEEIDTYIGGRIALPINGDAPPILGKLRSVSSKNSVKVKYQSAASPRLIRPMKGITQAAAG
jgi:phage gp36-like protein